jgi:hypothetical protein
MADKSFTSSSTYVIPGDEEFAYGIEQVEIKKHVWTPGADVLRGAMLHDRETGQNFFVTDADLARYAKPEPVPDIDLGQA